MSARNAGAGAAAPALHDPAWTARVFWTLAAAALLMPALWATEFRPWIMFEPESLRAWAALLLIAAGLGPFAGTLALAFHTTGVLGRLFAEAIENAPAGPAAALRVQGVPASRVL